jgi:hypothetical protein
MLILVFYDLFRLYSIRCNERGAKTLIKNTTQSYQWQEQEQWCLCTSEGCPPPFSIRQRIFNEQLHYLTTKWLVDLSRHYMADNFVNNNKTLMLILVFYDLFRLYSIRCNERGAKTSIKNTTQSYQWQEQEQEQWCLCTSEGRPPPLNLTILVQIKWQNNFAI